MFGKLKSLCIFARGFEKSSKPVIKKVNLRFKSYYHAKKNVSAVKKKEKKQTWFQGTNGFCKWKKGFGK